MSAGGPGIIARPLHGQFIADTANSVSGATSVENSDVGSGKQLTQLQTAGVAAGTRAKSFPLPYFLLNLPLSQPEKSQGKALSEKASHLEPRQ